MKSGKKTKTATAFVAAVLAAQLLTSIIATQIVLADIQSFGLEVSFSGRIAATLHDIAGLGMMLPILLVPAYLVAFTVAALAKKYLGGNRAYWFIMAGFASLPAVLLLLKSLLGAIPLAAARTDFGILLTALGGLAGGWLFSRLTRLGDD